MTTLACEETTVTRQQRVDGLNRDLAGEYQAIIGAGEAPPRVARLTSGETS